MVASGFLLRAIAGGVASDLALSQWFLLVAAFGSFFMVAGKRYSEIKSLGSEAGTRRSLERYSESYLRFAWMLAAVMVLISYSLWAFDNRGCGAYAVPWTAISIAPFTLGLLQYALEVDSGTRASPRRSSCTTGFCKGSDWSGSWSSPSRCSPDEAPSFVNAFPAMPGGGTDLDLPHIRPSAVEQQPPIPQRSSRSTAGAGRRERCRTCTASSPSPTRSRPCAAGPGAG